MTDKWIQASDMILRVGPQKEYCDRPIKVWPQPEPVRALSRASDPQTSKVAAESYADRKAKDEALIFEIICAAGENGCTYRECAAKLGWVEAVRVAHRLSAMPVIERRLKPDAKADDDFIERAGCAVWWKR